MSHLTRTLDRRESVLELDVDMATLFTRISSTASFINEDIEEEDAEHPEEGLIGFNNTEDYLFDVLSEGRGKVYLSKFLQTLYRVGLRKDDIRLKESMTKLKQAQKKMAAKGKDVGLDRKTFKECILPNIIMIKRAYEQDFVIPDFYTFSCKIEHIFNACREYSTGKPAQRIPELANVDPNLWGVSLCTIDGQRFSVGDSNVPFSLQSICKALNYALALHDLGDLTVHQYVGQEPSGVSKNEIKLDHNNKPHNPLINSGALVTVSLLQTEKSMADRFDYVSSQYKKMAAGEFLGFNNSMYLAEREKQGDFALAHYMQENKCFPAGAKLNETLDLCFQLASIEVTCSSAAVIAATLANGGTNPLTGEQVLNPEAVRNTLALMHSCGMYDYSGQFAFKVGLPAKSGVSGGIMLVVPNVMGMCLWSPPLDQCGNSVRGIEFCSKLIDSYNFHMYDNLLHRREKQDPRRKESKKGLVDLFTLLQAASTGDEKTIYRLFLSGVDMKISDYDGRTALHLAASQGHLNVVETLLDIAGVQISAKDRWDHTPLDNAKEFDHKEVQDYMEKWISLHPET